MTKRWVFLLVASWILSGSCAGRGDELGEGSPLASAVRRLAAGEEAIQAAAASELAAAKQLDTDAVAALIAALVDGDTATRRATVDALAAHPAAARVVDTELIGKATDDSQDDEARPMWYVASLALGRLGTRKLPVLIERLESAHPRTVRAACIAIAEMGPAAAAAVPQLTRLLDDPDDIKRHMACHALVGIGKPGAPAVQALIKLLEHDNFHSRYWSCRVLGSIGAPEALPAVDRLIALASESSASVRRNALTALGKIGMAAGPQLLPVLTAGLSDRVHQVSVASAESLGRVGPPAREALPALQATLEQPQFNARVPVAVAIWKISGDAELVVPVLLTEFQKITAPWEVAAAFAELGEAGAIAVPGLIDLLSSKQALTRLFVVAALAELGPQAKPALPALKLRLADDDEHVREAAQQAIDVIQGNTTGDGRTPGRDP